MRAGPSDHRGRSRDRRNIERNLPSDFRVASALEVSFKRIREERRSGKHWWRRYKSACLQLLEHLLFVCQSLINWSHPNTSQSILRRAGQIQGRIDQCRANYLPRRSEVLLPSLRRDQDAETVDSELEESVVLSSESEDELEIIDYRPAGVWSAGRYSGVRVSRSNPLLNQSSSASSSRPSSVVPRSAPPSRPNTPKVRLPDGVSVYPQIDRKLTHQNILSLDWHQVLDTVRISPWETLRSNNYTILPIIQGRLRKLKRNFPDILILVNSFCHCREYRDGVLSIPNWDVVDYRVVTREKTGYGGKLHALESILCSTARVCHIDDNSLVLDEFAAGSSSLDTKPLGIAIPRAGRRRPQQRTDQCDYYKSVVHALDQLITGFD